MQQSHTKKKELKYRETQRNTEKEESARDEIRTPAPFTSYANDSSVVRGSGAVSIEPLGCLENLSVQVIYKSYMKSIVKTHYENIMSRNI